MLVSELERKVKVKELVLQIVIKLQYKNSIP